VYLLETSQMTISQIGYEVGFNSPKYFTKAFKDEYNTTPSTYVSSIRQQQLKEKNS
jgi:AraC-like DNA-binding protein